MIRDTSTSVVVLRSVHHTGLAIARSLGRAGVSVYVVDSDAHPPAFASRYCRRKFIWDIDNSPPEQTTAWLLRLADWIGGNPLLIPTSDNAAMLVADHAAALKDRYRFQEPPPGLVRALCSKKQMHYLAREAGIPTAATFFPQSREEALQFASVAIFPIMLKAIDDRVTRQRAHQTKVIVRNEDELIEWYDALEDPQQPNLIFQEYIPGGEDTAWMFNGYFNQRTECLAGFTGRKIRQCPVYTGVTSLGICQRNETVERLTLRFMKSIGYRGIVDIDFRYDQRDGQYKVLDVNPRIGSTFRLLVGDNGMDVARALYLDLTQQPVPWASAREGRKWIVEDFDLASCLAYWRDGKLTAGEWIRSFRGIEECAFCSIDDPLPMISVCLTDFCELGRLLRKGGLLRPAQPVAETGGSSRNGFRGSWGRRAKG